MDIEEVDIMRSLLTRIAQDWSPFAATLLLWSIARWLSGGWGLLSYPIALAVASIGFYVARRAVWS